MNEQTAQQLSAHGVKPTAMRLLVLQVLQQHNSAKSISAIEEHLEPTERATLYRTLQTFEHHGIVHHIDDGTGITKYALCSSACSDQAHHDMHVHLHCTNCGTTTCLPDTQIPAVQLPENFKAQDYQLVIRGVCFCCF
jgi:Fur family ferric uptake transcriptional regulator